jgi:hypothetical protein
MKAQAFPRAIEQPVGPQPEKLSTGTPLYDTVTVQQPNKSSSTLGVAAAIEIEPMSAKAIKKIIFFILIKVLNQFQEFFKVVSKITDSKNVKRTILHCAMERCSLNF